MHVIRVLWLSPNWLPSFVCPFLTFDAASYAGPISLGQTSCGGCSLMSSSLVKPMFSGLKVLNVTGGKCRPWPMLPGGLTVPVSWGCRQLFCIWGDPRFLALDFQRPFVNVWNILVSDVSKGPRPSVRGTEEDERVIFARCPFSPCPHACF